MVAAVETMAYAGDVPWHGLGAKVNDTMTPEEMLEAAQLNWTVSKRPAYTLNALAVKTISPSKMRIPLSSSRSLFPMVR